MKKPPSLRLDQLVYERGLAESRARAQALIMAGSVLVGGQVKDKPGTRVSADAGIEVKEQLKYVSRGGGKLEGAMDFFGVDPSGLVCLDLGASTGGFTDLLLQRAAARVYCVDVGKGILAWKLREDPRVKVMEEINARHLKKEDLPELADLVTIDVSFISLTLILPAAAAALKPAGKILALVKPQFEAGKGEIGKGGVVRDPRVIAACVDKVSAAGAETGLLEQGRCPSPLKGPKGNQEIFILFSISEEKA